MVLYVCPDFRLDCWREKVALYSGDAFWRLGGNDVDAHYAAIGLGAVDRDLGPRAGGVSLEQISFID
jgi:hypothetical protein